MSRYGEIECPRCHRISFEFETHHNCTQCHWTIRPIPVAEPYGYEVLIEKIISLGRTETELRHYKGNETTARRRARSLGRVLAVVALSREQWLNAYGEGKM